jgi:hypothetical protein
MNIAGHVTTSSLTKIGRLVDLNLGKSLVGCANFTALPPPELMRYSFNSTMANNPTIGHVRGGRSGHEYEVAWNKHSGESIPDSRTRPTRKDAADVAGPVAELIVSCYIELVLPALIWLRMARYRLLYHGM